MEILWLSRPSPNALDAVLPRADLDLALSDELIQHEKIMALLRRLLADLDQLQQMLSHRLDEVVTFYLEEQTLLDGNGSLQCAETVEECQQLFTTTASELFRKHGLAQKVFNRTFDLLLCLDEANVICANTTRPHASVTVDDEQETPRGMYSKDLRELLASILCSKSFRAVRKIVEKKSKQSGCCIVGKKIICIKVHNLTLPRAMSITSPSAWSAKK